MSEDAVTLRSALGRLPAYTPGKPAAAPPGVTAYKISSNENPFPPLPSVLEAVRSAAGEMNRYPDMGVGTLTAALAERLEVPAERLAFGPGSVGVLGQTRMNYPQALATVEVVSERLGQRFEAAEAGTGG